MSLHSLNRHVGRYDFTQLTKSCPELAHFVVQSPRGEATINFTDADAVKALNRALLHHFYGISKWDIPPGYLCPPIPGRADYIHSVAELLSTCNEAGEIPRGNSVRVLDIGVGANCIYPLIGRAEYGWSFVGTESDPVALASAEKIVKENRLGSGIEFRKQSSTHQIFKGVIREGERFELSICNPPFHASLEEAQAGSRRKWNQLGVKSAGGGSKRVKENAPHLNFGGQSSELWCPGGEAAFVRRMIEESVAYAKQVRWFSTLVSKEANLPGIQAMLKKSKVIESLALEMAQGQKKSRIVAWTF